MRITSLELLSVLDSPELNPLSFYVHASTTSMAMQVRQPTLKTTSIGYRDAEFPISERTLSGVVPTRGTVGEGYGQVSPKGKRRANRRSVMSQDIQNTYKCQLGQHEGLFDFPVLAKQILSYKLPPDSHLEA